jgi:hypothetical protein
MRLRLTSFLALIVVMGSLAESALAMQRLRVSNNGRFLVLQDGTPFFWQGDTNWRLTKLTPEDVNHYLDDRASKGYNLIQGPVLLHLNGGPEFSDPWGNTNTNPLSPNESYFQHVDYIVDAAAARGMYIALVGIWGGELEVFGSTQAQRLSRASAFGEYVGNRYRNRSNVVFIVAGEYNQLGNDAQNCAVWSALANGFRDASNNSILITIHASYQAQHQSSSIMFHDAGWLSFNMIQSSQSGNSGAGANNWQLVTTDYQLSPIKPVLDGEAHYEGLGGWNAFGVRRRAYWSVFAGAFGHTYGSIPVAVSYRPGDVNYYGNPDPWWVGIDYPGAHDMRHLRRLMESRPMLKRVPADSMLITPSGGVPNRIIATRDQLGRYAMVYVPTKNKTFTVYTAGLSGSTIKTWWYDCRNGRVRNGGQFNKNGYGGYRTFTTPNEGQDWVLVLDDKTQGFPKPGIGGPLP